MKKSLMLLIAVIVFSFSSPSGEIIAGSLTEMAPVKVCDRLALVTYVSDNIQAKHAEILVESLRQNGGLYSGSEVYAVITDSLVECDELSRMQGVITLHLRLDGVKATYPYAVKAFAAAHAEEAVGNRADYIAWFDPETLILSQPDGLVPGNGAKAVVQPVFLSNTVGLAPGEQPDDFWEPVYRTVKTDIRKIPVVETLFDRQKVMAYYNCEIFSVRRDAHIFSKWAEALDRLLSDSLFAFVTCNTPQRMTFLHQAVLSAVIIHETSGSTPAVLPLSNGYPLHIQEKIPAERAITSLDSVSCAILESLWAYYPNWMDNITASEKLTEKLSGLYLRFMEVAPGIFRQEGSCNSYLVLTGDSSILIDPAGCASCPVWFRKLTSNHPLSLIILTHGHNDHRDNTDSWSDNGAVTVVAQSGIKDLIAYQEMLSGFFRRRNAIWSGRDISTFADTVISNPKITVYYDDSLSLRRGDLTLKIIHTSGETPDHSLIYIPEKRAVFVGDNYYSSFPNLYTLRGTKPRWALDYVRALDSALAAKPVFLFPGHGFWLRGTGQVNFFAGGYRNAIRYIHDETVKGMNEGRDRYSLMREIRLPKEYSFIDQTYGTVRWSVRGIYEGYAGWFDEKPSSMYELPLSSIGEDLIGLTGVGPALDLARSYIEKEDFVRGLHLTELILTAIPGNREALDLERGVLTGLKKRSQNYIERIWLNYGLSGCGASK